MKNQIETCLLLVGFLALGLVAATGCTDVAVGENSVYLSQTEKATTNSDHFALSINDSNFESKVLNSKTPVLLDFWATWCGPCVQLTPTIESIAQDYEGRLVVGKVDVDQQASLAAKYGITSIPALIYLKDGKVIHRSVGVKTRSQLDKEIASVLQ